MKVNVEACPFKVDKRLAEILETEVKKANVPSGVPVVLNFRSPDYDAESGGFMPVEIRLSAKGSIVYATDFCYVGHGPFAELAKNVDFDFGLQVLQLLGRDFPIQEGKELWQSFQVNFIEYYKVGTYEVTVTAES